MRVDPTLERRPLDFVVDAPAATPDGCALLPQADPSSAEWQRLARRARRLSWTSLGWLGIEGGLSVIAAVLSGSVALLGFGIDTIIEAIASVIIVWRFSGARLLSETSERRAQLVVAVSFFLLAPYIAAESLRALVIEHHADTTWLGIATASLSLMWCPVLGTMKCRIGARLGSLATRSEGLQNQLCAGLAATTLVGLLANTLFGVWWLDPVAGLVIALAAVDAGRTAWRGEACDCC